MTDVPTHPAITTRRAFNERRQRETFEPVAVPGDTRRYRLLAAIGPSLGGLFLFLWIAACVVAFVMGYSNG